MILLDCNALCYQAHFTMRTLARHDGTPTGVIYGFWAQVKTIVEQCNDAMLVFCWDSDDSYRMTLCETYKANRNEMREKDPTIFEAFYQFEELRDKIIPMLGFNNFHSNGFEADDIIAQLCDEYRDKKKIIIASNDQDLYQCLHGSVSMYKTRFGSFYTKNDFVDEFGISPALWPYVKAIAGCPGDNVIGIKGVGVKTVCRYLNDTTDKKYPKIDNPEAKKIIALNWQLVKLPFETTPHYQVNFEPHLDYQKWKELCYEYEFKKYLHDNFFRDLFLGKAPTAFSAPPPRRQHPRKRGK